MNQQDRLLMDLRLHGIVETKDDENFRLTEKMLQQYEFELSVFQADPGVSAEDQKGLALIKALAKLFYPESFLKAHAKIVVAIARLTIWKGPDY